MSSESGRIRTLLVANRGEIALRILRAARELGIRTVAVYSSQDALARHRFSADVSYLIGRGQGAVDAYLDIADLMRIAAASDADAIHPGYGFLAENPALAQACEDHGVRFVGPSPHVLTMLGDKVQARALAVRARVPVLPATGPLPPDSETWLQLADTIGYPVMVKASWGGGGRGMRVVRQPDALIAAVESASREARRAVGNGDVYLEKYIEHARHVEVQLLGDTHGGLIHLFERDCSLQRRHQKVVERAPAPYLSDAQRSEVCGLAVRIGREARYTHAGTVEFLQDTRSGAWYFIEVNPRIQVEHTVTEVATGVDLVHAQLRITEGHAIGGVDSGIPCQDAVRLHRHAIQCRVTTEDPAQDFLPASGTLQHVQVCRGPGVRVDEGDIRPGVALSAHYDSLLLKVTVEASTAASAKARMIRALGECVVDGVATNIDFLTRLLMHPEVQRDGYTTQFLDQHPELCKTPSASVSLEGALRYVAERSVARAHDTATRRARPLEESLSGRASSAGVTMRPPAVPHVCSDVPVTGYRSTLQSLGPEGFARFMRQREGVLVTDTTLRDAHQSLFATRMRTSDMLPIAPAYAQHLSRLLSLECWGGATFDAAMRFLQEDPWERLELLREAIPHIPFQMLMRANNAVGYTNYPQHIVRYFIDQAAKAGIDIFRVFDALNSVAHMRTAIAAVRESGAFCEASICYTGDIFDPTRRKYDLRYYLRLAEDLEASGAHAIAIKDMAGLCKPQAAATLVSALREHVGLPIHFHTHDTSGNGMASVLAAVHAGVDAVDCAMDALSGLNSQVGLGALSEALRGSRRDPDLPIEAIRDVSRYFAGVRECYADFESGTRATNPDVYRHEIPGGQYTNLQEQARSMGLGDRFDEVVDAYAAVNRLFGDIVKVTPTSKVVGDLALCMVANHLTPASVVDEHTVVPFPASVVSLMRGEMGEPFDGFPQALQSKVLAYAEASGIPYPRAVAIDVEEERRVAEERWGRAVDDRRLASYLMYPDVSTAMEEHRRTYGALASLPTPVFFHGLAIGEACTFVQAHRPIHLTLAALVEDVSSGGIWAEFLVNGARRRVLVEQAVASHSQKDERAPNVDASNPFHVGASMPGTVTRVVVERGHVVRQGQPLLYLEAMKMEMVICAERAAVVSRLCVGAGDTVEAGALLLELAAVDASASAAEVAP